MTRRTLCASWPASADYDDPRTVRLNFRPPDVRTMASLHGACLLLVLCHGGHDPDARCGGTKVSRIQMSPVVQVAKDMWCHVVGALPWGP